MRTQVRLPREDSALHGVMESTRKKQKLILNAESHSKKWGYCCCSIFKRIHLSSTVEMEPQSLSSDSNPKDDHYSLVYSDSNGNRREAHSRMDRNLDLVSILGKIERVVPPTRTGILRKKDRTRNSLVRALVNVTSRGMPYKIR